MFKSQVLDELPSGSKIVPADVSIPDALLPEQYFDRLASQAAAIPEKRLMLAVLLDAIVQFQRRNARTAAEAERWIRGEYPDLSPFTFQDVCENLGIEPAYLSRGLLAWQSASDKRPFRRLRTSQRRVTPLGRRRRRLDATAGASSQDET